jgi:hypothetical protein
MDRRYASNPKSTHPMPLRTSRLLALRTAAIAFTTLILTILLAPRPLLAGTSYKSFRDSMLATGRLVPLSGLADDAFYISSAGNSAATAAPPKACGLITP